MDVGSRSLGILLNALFAMPLKAASWFPAAHCRIGFRAQTYPVTSEKIDTPIRPCRRIRIMGYWSKRGASCSCSVALKMPSSNARARCVKTTRMDAMPRRPYDQNRFWSVELRLDCVHADVAVIWRTEIISGESAKAELTSTHFTFSCLTLILSSPIYITDTYTSTKGKVRSKSLALSESCRIQFSLPWRSCSRRWLKKERGLGKGQADSQRRVFRKTLQQMIRGSRRICIK